MKNSVRAAISFFSLFASSATLVCCALPALLVLLGFGSTVAAFVSAFPSVTLLSEHKAAVFGTAGLLLALSAVLSAVRTECPPSEKEACSMTRTASRGIFLISSIFFLIGATVAFILPLFMN